MTPVVDERPDGTIVVRARQPLGDYPAVLTDRLAHWAGIAPDRTLLAWHTRTASHEEHGSVSRDRAFAHLTYGDALRKVRCLGQALLDRGLSAERPLAILSGNSVEHLLLALAAQHVGIPYAPVSPAYSLVSTDFGALKHVLGLLTPGLVFASDAALFERALDAAVARDVDLAHAGPGSVRSRAPWDGDVRGAACDDARRRMSIGATRRSRPTMSPRSSSRRARRARRRASSTPTA